MGRPVNKRYFGPDASIDAGVQAEATYDTDNSGVVTNITVTEGGTRYSDNFSVIVTNNGEEATINFTVVDGVVTSGTLGPQSDPFDADLSDVAIDMPAPAGAEADAFQILGSANLGAGVEDVFIVRQRSSRKYEVAAAADPTRRGVCKTVASSTPGVGELYIPVNGDVTEAARIIHNRTVRTFTPSRRVWNPTNNVLGDDVV